MIVRLLVGVISIASIQSISCFAESVTSLPQLEGFSAFVLEKNGSYVTECGQSKIRVKGVNGFNGNSFYFIDMDNAEIRISNQNKSLTLGNSFLNDFNGVACIKKNRQLILIWGNCGGSSCGDRSDVFYIINSSTLEFIQSKKRKRSICNEQCASKIVGRAVIEKINNW